jgi:hypothetical protein
MNQDNKSEIVSTETEIGEKVPNESAGFYFSSFLKISDPQTGQVLVQTRAD